MIDKTDDELRADLKSKVADERFMAAYVVGERRLRWPAELIPLLDDHEDLIGQAARRSLIILSFLELNPEEADLIAAGDRGRPPTPLAKLNKPVDFGPAPGATKAARKTAIEKWTDWWDARKGGASTAAGSSLRSVGVRSDSLRLADALVKADGGPKDKLVADYRDTKGVQYTEALAAAIERSPSAARKELRDALADRMGRMTATTLGRDLEDSLAEIRRAAALGLARKGNTALADRLADRLTDPEPLVREAAHAALCQLSQADLGPGDGAGEADRAEAAAQWKTRWATHPAGK